MALVTVQFRWSGGGREVFLCTDYYGWESNKIRMSCSCTSPVFTAVVELPVGCQEYKYIVDGQWKHDPNKETTPNVFGTLNNVVRVTQTTQEIQPAQEIKTVQVTKTVQQTRTVQEPKPQEAGQVTVTPIRVVQEVCHGTITPAAPFDPEADADALRKAMKGLGTDEKTIIAILAHRSNSQRQTIKNKFKVKYGKDLTKQLESELTGNLEDCVLALMEPASLYDARSLRRAIKGAGTDEECLIEILCSRSNAEIQQIKQAYKAEYRRDLEKDVAGDTSGHFKRLLVSLCQGAREESMEVDMAKAQKEAWELYQAGEKKWGTDESVFNKIITVRSFPQLRATFDAYVKIAQRDIADSIKSEMSGDVRDGMLAVVQCVRNRQVFFADQLYKSMKGVGTNDDTLIRIVVSRSEVDLVEIKKAFQERQKKSLYKMIEGDTSGDYRRLLLAIVRPN